MASKWYTVQAVCPDCGRERTIRWWSTKPQKKVCRSCAEHRKNPDRLPRELVCTICGETYMRAAFWVDRGSKYCSAKCQAEGYRQRRKGTGNPHYRHGKRTGEHDRAMIRSFSLEVKGEDRCRLCGTRENIGLHHAIPRSIGTPESKKNILNGVPLCTWHHLGWHRKLVVLYRDLFTEEEWAYMSSVVLTGREIEAWLDDHYPMRPEEAVA